MNSYFNQVLHAFSTMDIELLEDLLDPTIPYSDVPIGLFLERLEKAFESFREEGDTFLTSQPGNCCNLNCNPDSIRTAYRFVGNKTRLYLDFRFIIEITEDLKDHRVLDIYSCSSLKCFEPLDWYANDIPFCFYDDENVNFQKSPELLIYLEKKKEAMNEFKSVTGQMTESELRSWILRYQSAYDFFETFPARGYFSWSDFTMHYNASIKRIKFVEQLTKPAFLEEIYKENESSERNLIQKIIQVEQILIDNENEYLIWVWKNENQYFFKDYNCFLVDGIFDSFAKLWAWFKPQQLELLMKYFALTPNETEEFCSNQKNYSSTDTIYTLSFHLDIRKKTRSKGEYIPMGLWSDEQPMPFWSDSPNQLS